MERHNGCCWEQHAEAEKACLDLLEDCRHKNITLFRLEQELIRHTSSRIFDWIDHFYLSDTRQTREKLSRLGFVKQPGVRRDAYYHPGALLPTIVLAPRSFRHELGVALRVENISVFLQVNGFRAELEGVPLGMYRRALLGTEGGISLMVVERRGTRDYEPDDPGDSYQRSYLEAFDLWRNRPRIDENADLVFDQILQIADRLIDNLGYDLAAHIVCECELCYWLSRNFAARIQHGRQLAAGFGWANHDHYTFRSSRRNFPKLLALFARLGFRSRERFYAGREAGWGAQVMENPAGLVLFLDVDLLPDEAEENFSLNDLKPCETLGTVGLWCELHGDSILQAGMHHLAARFDFGRLISDIAQFGVSYMAPFSDLPYLKQAFSAAERWEVDPKRLERLVEQKAITGEQAEKFLSYGAVGSHLENIERREGYKGFNKKNVSSIIRDTDPRKHAA